VQAGRHGSSSSYVARLYDDVCSPASSVVTELSLKLARRRLVVIGHAAADLPGRSLLVGFTFLLPAHPASKRVYVCMHVCYYCFLIPRVVWSPGVKNKKLKTNHWRLNEYYYSGVESKNNLRFS